MPVYLKQFDILIRCSIIFLDSFINSFKMLLISVFPYSLYFKIRSFNQTLNYFNFSLSFNSLPLTPTIKSFYYFDALIVVLIFTFVGIFKSLILSFKRRMNICLVNAYSNSVQLAAPILSFREHYQSLQQYRRKNSALCFVIMSGLSMYAVV